MSDMKKKKKNCVFPGFRIFNFSFRDTEYSLEEYALNFPRNHTAQTFNPAAGPIIAVYYLQDDYNLLLDNFNEARWNPTPKTYYEISGNG